MNDLALKLASDVRLFTHALWIDQGLDKLAPLSDVELDMLDFMANGNAGRRCVLGFRGIGKTHIVSALCCYRMLRDPNREILLISKSQPEAKKTLGLIRKWIGSVPFLRHLAPSDGDADAATYFVSRLKRNSRSNSVACLGVQGQLEGNRGHTIIADDIETLANSRTLEARLQLRSYANEFVNICYPNTGFKAGEHPDPVEIIGVGTPKHEETLYLEWAKQGWEVRGYPIVYPGADEQTINLAPILAHKLASGQAKPGDPTVPLRFGPAEIADRRSQGRAVWLREFMLSATLGDTDRYPFKLADFIVFDWGHHDVAPVQLHWGRRDADNASTRIEDIESLGFHQDGFHRPTWHSKDYARFSHTIIAVDPAGFGGDSIGYAVVSHLRGSLFVHDVGGLKGGPSTENISKLAHAARKYNARIAKVESNRGGEAFAALLQVALSALARSQPPQPADQDTQPWACTVESKFAAGNKEERVVNTLEPVLAAHRLIIHPRVAKNTTLQYQITRYTREKNTLAHDDEIDALASAVAYFLHELNIDPALSVTTRTIEQDRIEQLHAFVDELNAKASHQSPDPTPHFARSAPRFKPSWTHK